MSSSRSNVKTSNGSMSALTIGIIIIVVLIFIGACWCNFTESGKSAFANIKSKFSTGSGGSSGLKELDIVMFMSPTCPWCKKMVSVLDKESQLNQITVVDMTKPEGIAMAKQFGADKQPVPSFISRKLKTGAVGFRESVNDLVKALKQPQPQSQPQPQPQQGRIGGPGSSEEPGGMGGNIGGIVHGLQIVLFAREGCPWCTKAKESLSNAGVLEVVQIIDITTPEGQQMAAQLLPPGTSNVPSWVSMATKKHVVGYKPIEQIIQELK